MNTVFLLLLVVSACNSFLTTSKPQPCESSKLNNKRCPVFEHFTPGSNHTLVCPLTGVTYIFYQNGKSIATKQRFMVTGNTLHITNFDIKNDLGKYQCLTRIKNGTIESWYWVVLMASNHGNGSPKHTNMSAIVGKKVVFDCSHIGDMALYKYDLLNKKPVLFSRVSFQQAKGIYQFRVKLTDSGIYCCGGKSRCSYTSFTLTVTKPAPAVGFLVIKRFPGEDHFYKAGETAQFTCVLISTIINRSKSISWYKGKKKIASKQTNKSNDELTLTLTNLDASYASNYTCQVTFGGRTITKMTTLKIFVFNPPLLPNGKRIMTEKYATTNETAVVIFCGSNQKDAKYSLSKQRLLKLNQVNIVKNSRMQSGQTGTFLIFPLRKKDKGYIYICNATLPSSAVYITTMAGIL